VSDIPTGSVDDILLVDDGSRDDTVAIARQLGLRVIEHGANRPVLGAAAGTRALAAVRAADATPGTSR
jgi:glycosyltransferase involved in cell wall biosynthesis